MKRGKYIHKRRSGFLLMETILAILIFATFATGIAFSIHSSAKLQETIERKKWINRQKQNIITLVARLPQTKQDFTQSRLITLQESGASALVTVEPSILRSQTGSVLPDLFTITITLTWYKGGEKKTEKFSLESYYPLYQ